MLLFTKERAIFCPPSAGAAGQARPVKMIKCGTGRDRQSLNASKDGLRCTVTPAKHAAATTRIAPETACLNVPG